MMLKPCVIRGWGLLVANLVYFSGSGLDRAAVSSASVNEYL